MGVRYVCVPETALALSPPLAKGVGAVLSTFFILMCMSAEHIVRKHAHTPSASSQVFSAAVSFWLLLVPSSDSGYRLQGDTLIGSSGVCSAPGTRHCSTPGIQT